jgi:hypothetical protein
MLIYQTIFKKIKLPIRNIDLLKITFNFFISTIVCLFADYCRMWGRDDVASWGESFDPLPITIKYLKANGS